MERGAFLRLDPLHIFAVSVAAFLAALLFLIAVVSDVSVGTAATRAIVGWCILSALGIALAMLVRWVLATPPPTRPPTSSHLDHVID